MLNDRHAERLRVMLVLWLQFQNQRYAAWLRTARPLGEGSQVAVEGRRRLRSRASKQWWSMACLKLDLEHVRIGLPKHYPGDEVRYRLD